jgi:inhibitor of cysteine peptidase
MNNDPTLASQNEEMLSKIGTAVQEYDLRKQLEASGTIIHRIAIDNGRIEYGAKGEVIGSLLNQFSMDESGGNLRVATTFDTWLRERVQFNNVYVLDQGMNTIGKLENVSANERIYSARFIGDKLYLVTYQQTDPLFVIDLAEPTSPKVLGELKMPGFSTYLHPVDATHLIGIGRETGENEYGQTVTKGIKIALFDVSDFANPKLVDKYEIGGRDSDSAALYEHKAFLFSATKGMLVIPITEMTTQDKISQYEYNYGIWTGAYVFRVNSTGFQKMGTVEHSSYTNRYFDWGSGTAVTRSLYMDNNLYTISSKYVKANDLANGLAPLGTLNLPQTAGGYYYRYV